MEPLLFYVFDHNTVIIILLGKDPFVDKMDSKGIDSVAGVLKLYFRELRKPLFPSELFEELASFISNRSFTGK